MNKKRAYPYLVARDKHTKWQFYLTIKPNKRVYLQGISKVKLRQLRKLTVEKEYIKEVSKLKNGDIKKPNKATTFYKKVFGTKAIATHI